MSKQEFGAFLNEYWGALTEAYADPAAYDSVRDTYMSRYLAHLANERRSRAAAAVRT